MEFFTPRSAILAGLAMFALSAPNFAVAAQPKYGPEATVLSRSNQYVRRNPAPDFWAMIPYYSAQINGRACSAASVEMVVNAARAARTLGSEDELATQSVMMQKVKDDTWRTGVLSEQGQGVALDQLGNLVKEALALYDVGVETIETVHVENDSPATIAKVKALLVQNEKSARDFVIANFIQKTYTGDAEVGHVAPVAAWDAKASRVLIFDPDRQWYEPYWVSLETFVRGMATQDKGAGKSRGYVYVRTKLPER